MNRINKQSDSGQFINSSDCVYWYDSLYLLTRVVYLLTRVILFIDSSHFIYWLESFYLLTQVIVFIDMIHYIYWLGHYIYWLGHYIYWLGSLHFVKSIHVKNEKLKELKVWDRWIISDDLSHALPDALSHALSNVLSHALPDSPPDATSLTWAASSLRRRPG